MQYLNSLPDPGNFLLVTDDVTADRLYAKGHLDGVIRKAINCGLDPILAIQATTIRAARRLRLYQHGCIGPGRVADIVLLDSLEDFTIDTVVADGEVVARKGKMVKSLPNRGFPRQAYNTVKLPELTPGDFAIKTNQPDGVAEVTAIVVNEFNSQTQGEKLELPIENGVLSLKDTDLSIIGVFERHGIKGNRSLGILKNLGSFKGAMATTYAHDSHNLVVIGNNAADLALAANTLIESGGGMAAVKDGKVLASVELPIAGLLSPKPIEEIAKEIIFFAETLREMGLKHREPIMLLTILSLAVSPQIKITDLGLVDVVNKKFVELITPGKGGN
jgi:adenine deaminase